MHSRVQAGRRIVTLRYCTDQRGWGVVELGTVLVKHCSVESSFGVVRYGNGEETYGR